MAEYNEYKLISVDSHFVEAPNMWAKRTQGKFRDRTPQTVTGLNGRDGEASSSGKRRQSKEPNPRG